MSDTSHRFIFPATPKERKLFNREPDEEEDEEGELEEREEGDEGGTGVSIRLAGPTLSLEIHIVGTDPDHAADLALGLVDALKRRFKFDF